MPLADSNAFGPNKDRILSDYLHPEMKHDPKVISLTRYILITRRNKSRYKKEVNEMCYRLYHNSLSVHFYVKNT